MRRRGKHLILETSGGLAVLIHLMSAGRLQLYEKRAGPRDRTSRLLVRITGEARNGTPRDVELRLREFGSKQAAWVKVLAADALEQDDALATLGPEAWPDPPPLAGLLDAPRPLHAILRDQHVIAGIGRSWADEILWEAQLSPYKRGADLDEAEAERLREAMVATLGRAHRPLRGRDPPAHPRQAADATARAPPSGRALPALRSHASGRALRGLRHRLLPRMPDRGTRAQGPPPLAPASMTRLVSPPAIRPSRPSAALHSRPAPQWPPRENA